MARALVTGGAGFIGSHVVDRLLREGWRVRVLDNLSTGFQENLSGDRSAAEWLEGDLRDARSCREACRDVDTVFHLAAVASVAHSVEDPLHTHAVNTAGTLNLLLAARDAGVRRLVFSSSAAVYGNAECSPTDETQPFAPQSPYATEKIAGEHYCRNFHHLYGVETVILRYFNVFGPRQSATSGYAAAIPLFLAAALGGEQPTVFGDGLQTRDFVYVENVAAANVLAASSPAAAGGVFNIGGGAGISLLQLLEEIGRAAGRPLAPRFAPPRAGDVRHSRAAIDRARQVLGYSPSVGLAEGLRRTVEAARSGSMPLRAAA